MNKEDLLEHLKSAGCKLLREDGGLPWWVHPASGRRSAVPRHSEISCILAQKICKDLGIAPAGPLE